MDKILWVGAGGFIGSALRYLVGGYVQQLSGSVSFPYGTFAVNIIGCFVIGLLSQVVALRGILSDEVRLLVLTGLLGGFTTFSTFSNESFALLHKGQTWLALANIGGQLVLGLAAVWAGTAVAWFLWR